MKIQYSRLSTKNLGTLADRFIAISMRAEHAFIHDNPLLAMLRDAYLPYNEVLIKRRSAGMGDDVALADLQRDKHYLVLKNLVMAAAAAEGHPYAAAAQALLPVYELMGDSVTRLSYAEQTAVMQRFVLEMDKAENQALLTTMQSVPLYTKVKDAQATFENLYHDQAHANAELSAQASASALRSDLENALRSYAGMLTSYQQVDGYRQLYLELKEIADAAGSRSTDDEDDDVPPVA